MPDQHHQCAERYPKKPGLRQWGSGVRLKLDSFTNRRLQYASVAWLLVLVVGSLWGDAKFALHTYRGENGLRHRVLHILCFGSTALWFLFLSTSRRQQLLVVLGIFCLGVILEVVQCLTYRNAFEWWDVRDDCYGIILAFVLYWVWSRGRGKTKIGTHF
jgi:hypothetical protein